jgi:hypothetical protein
MNREYSIGVWRAATGKHSRLPIIRSQENSQSTIGNS